MMNQDHFIGPVNIGNPGEFTIRELAELVLQMTGSKSSLIRKPLLRMNPRVVGRTYDWLKRSWDGKPRSIARWLAKDNPMVSSINMDHYRPPTPNFI